MGVGRRLARDSPHQTPTQKQSGGLTVRERRRPDGTHFWRRPPPLPPGRPGLGPKAPDPWGPSAIVSGLVPTPQLLGAACRLPAEAWRPGCGVGVGGRYLGTVA